MDLILTSCGLETQEIQKAFENMLPKSPDKIRAMFITTAAIYPDAVDVLPKCLADLTKCGIDRKNITVYDMHERFTGNIFDSFDVVYICGGDPYYLMRRINEQGFNDRLMDYIRHDGVVLGVSAGSMIFADDMPDNLGVLKCPLDVHCDDNICETAGYYPCDRTERIRLGNRQAIVFENGKIKVI